MEDKYAMLVDENGQPYIAHSINLRQTVRNVGNSVRSAGSNAINAARTTASNARSGAGRGVRAVHKYIAKIGEGAQARYFYTQEELRAYQQQAARQAQGMANKAGQTMRNVGNKAGQAMKNEGNSVQNSGRKVVNTIKDKAGVDERQRAEEAWSKVPKQLSSKDEKGMQAFKEANKAQDEYRNTLLGRAEYAAERAKEIATGVDGSARDIAEKAGNAVKSKYDRIRDEFKDTFRKEPPKAELFPEGTERIIKENIIPETIIREDKIHENKIKENVTPEKRIIEKVISEGKVRNKKQDKTAEKVDSESLSNNNSPESKRSRQRDRMEFNQKVNDVNAAEKEYRETMTDKNASEQDKDKARQKFKSAMDSYTNLMREQDKRGVHYGYNGDSGLEIDEAVKDAEDYYDSVRKEVGDDKK